MTENLVLALQITLIGMSLVFGAILLLWLLMSVLVRFTAGQAPSQEEAVERDRRRRAAGVAVAMALASREDNQPSVFPLPPTALVTAWQAVTRAYNLGRRSRS